MYTKIIYFYKNQKTPYNLLYLFFFSLHISSQYIFSWISRHLCASKHQTPILCTICWMHLPNLSRLQLIDFSVRPEL